MKYTYTAYNGKMQKQKGIINATDASIAQYALLEMGFQPISIKPKFVLPSLDEAFPTTFGVKIPHVILFSQQLASLLEAGIAIIPALETLHHQIGNTAFKKIMGSMISDIHAGDSFSEVIVKYPQAFNEMYCKTLHACEKAGDLALGLRQMGSYMEKRIASTKKAKKALTYPVMMIGLSVVVVILMMVVVLPKMTSIFTSAGAQLPVPTRILIGMSNFMSNNLLLLAIVTAAIVVPLVIYFKQPSGRRKLHRLLLTAPLFGPMNTASEMARFSRTMSMLLQAGLPLHEVMDMVVKTSTNQEVNSVLRQVNDELLRGQGLAFPMSKQPIFPKLIVDMVTLGEENSNLESNFSDMARLYEEIADEKLNNFFGVLKPAMTIGISGLVGFIAISIMMPMYGMMSAMG